MTAAKTKLAPPKTSTKEQVRYIRTLLEEDVARRRMRVREAIEKERALEEEAQLTHSMADVSLSTLKRRLGQLRSTRVKREQEVETAKGVRDAWARLHADDTLPR